MKIFNVVLLSVLCAIPVAGRGEDIDCGYFNPAFGLCSTHSHNIGFLDGEKHLPANPTKSEEVAQMNAVIALKSTVIAQQLKEQYDELNAIIKRFKTQLEKAVLTSKIEVITGNAASGNSGGGSSGSYSSGGNIAGIRDCAMVDYANVFECLAYNAQLIVSAADSNIAEARKQLLNDLRIAEGFGVCEAKIQGATTTSCYDVVTSCHKFYDSKKEVLDRSSAQKNDVVSCARAFSQRLSKSKYDLNNRNYSKKD